MCLGTQNTEASGSGIIAANTAVPTLTDAGVPRAKIFVLFEFDTEAKARELPPGASGAVAICSSQGIQQTSMIRRVAIRFYSYLNYVLPDG